MASLPWSNIPTLLVPFYLILHGIMFTRLARAKSKAETGDFAAARLPVDNGNNGDFDSSSVARST
jgi:hypothetical protein